MVIALFAAIPAQAVTSFVSVSTTNLAIEDDGTGQVFATCHATKTCKGKVYLVGGNKPATAFSIGAKKSTYIAIRMDYSQQANPYCADHPTRCPAGSPDGDGDLHNKSATLVINEDAPKNVTHSQAVNVEKAGRQNISGKVTGAVPAATGVKVTLWRTVRGGNTRQLKYADITDVKDTYSFSVPLGINNSPADPFQLRISGYDQNGEFRAWWWRGTDGVANGGGKYIIEATDVTATKAGPYTADFTYGSMTGTVTHGGAPVKQAQVTVAAPPVNYSSSATKNRELDIQGCANVLGQTTATDEGVYTVGFLPVKAGDKRYMVQAKSPVPLTSTDGRPALPLWNGIYRSCFGATANLYELNPNPDLIDMTSSDATIAVNASYSGYTPTALGDRHLSLRESIPGRAILDSPVVATLDGDAAGRGTFTDLGAGSYWVEVGRRTSCSAWYKSFYTDNNAYLSGEDRGAERWKTVNGREEEHKKSLEMGYKRATPPTGYRGWMYRNYCKAIGTGSYQKVEIKNISGSDADAATANPTVARGAVIKGHIRRLDGRINKEMLVTAYSTAGKNVLRTGYTNSHGNFTIEGLPTGTFKLGINLDSWRGIGRSFDGTHTKAVTTGKTYNIGTLKFKG